MVWGTGPGGHTGSSEQVRGSDWVPDPLPSQSDWAESSASQVKLETELCLQLGK